MISTITTGIIFIIILSILVFIHELGHFLVAILIGVRVEEFGFGLPPMWKKLTTFKIRNSNVDLTLNYLPVGGFVRLAGEDEDEKTIEARLKKYKGKSVKEFFWARSKKERAAILLAGVTMNFLLACGITTGLLIQGLEEPGTRVQIDAILPGTPAQQAGILPGDLVREIHFTDEAGNVKTAPTRIPEELVTATKANAGKEIQLVIDRSGKEVIIPITPRKEFPQGEGPMGIRIGFEIQTLKFPWYEAPFQAVKLNLVRGRDMFVSLATLPYRAILGQKVSDEVAGPLGIAQVTGQAAQLGLSAVLNLMSILSLSLAMLNVLPIPALDGGRLLFVVIEKIIGRRVHQGFEQRAHQIGMIVLLGLILLVTLNDVSRFFKG